jgi:hypothetical protein
LSEEEEKKLSRLEKRLVANVDFDHQALNALGFVTDIYYMLGHLGWVQFSNGVSANTHKEFALENLMTMAPILDEGCTIYHSVWREFNKWFPTSILRSYLGSKRELRRKLTCRKACWMDFGIYVSGEAHQLEHRVQMSRAKVSVRTVCLGESERLQEVLLEE